MTAANSSTNSMTEQIMQEFKKVPATKRSYATRRPLFGVGINDSDYKISATINGKKVSCPVYSRWASILARVYSANVHDKFKTYINCTVCDEWLTFSNFKAWHEANHIDGYEIDKDIKIKGNKVYSPDTCLFVPYQINYLILNSDLYSANAPTGVRQLNNGKYLSRLKIDGVIKYIGRFSNLDDAHHAYKSSKNAEIMRKSRQYPEFAKYLTQHLHEV